MNISFTANYVCILLSRMKFVKRHYHNLQSNAGEDIFAVVRLYHYWEVCSREIQIEYHLGDLEPHETCDMEPILRFLTLWSDRAVSLFETTGPRHTGSYLGSQYTYIGVFPLLHF